MIGTKRPKKSRPSSKKPTPNKPQNVLILIDAWYPFVGGGQVHVKNLSHQLKKQFHLKTTIIAPKHTSILHRFLWIFWVIPTAIIRHQKQPFDLIHSHGFLPGLPAKIISIILNLPLIHTVHGSHLLDQQAKGLKARAEKFLLTQIKYTAQITVSRNFTFYPNLNSNIHYIPNGVNLKQFDQPANHPTSPPTILFIGRDHPDKGIDTLRQAQKIIQTKNIPANFRYVINGHHSHKQLIRIYKQSSIFVLPSRAEGQPITLLEAWAAKVPTITTTVGDNPYLVKPKQTGLLVPPDNPTALADAISFLLQNPKKAAHIAKAAYRQVKLNHTWEKIARQTYKVYTSCYNTTDH